MRPRVKLRLVSCLAATLLLFAQTVAIAQACIAVDATPAIAFTEVSGVQGCHGDGPVSPQPNPNACLQHCTAGDQTTAQAPAALPALPSVAVLTVPVLTENVTMFARAHACELNSPDPPRSLRFCSFQL